MAEWLIPLDSHMLYSRFESLFRGRSGGGQIVGQRRQAVESPPWRGCCDCAGVPDRQRLQGTRSLD